MRVPLILREELLYGSEDHTAGIDQKLAAQVCSTLRLGWRLVQQILTTGEGAEELVVPGRCGP